MGRGFVGVCAVVFGLGAACTSDTLGLDAANGIVRDLGVRDAGPQAETGPRDLGSPDRFDPVDFGPPPDATHADDLGFDDRGFTDGPHDGGFHDADRHDARPDVGFHDVGAQHDAGQICMGSGQAPTPVCQDAGVCGNGVRNRCTVCTNSRLHRAFLPDTGGPICMEVTEECDDLDLGGRSCQALGYAGGNLSCGAWCGFDPRACRGCGNNTIVGSCNEPEMELERLVALDMAAGGLELGVVWSGEGSGVQFARYDADVNLIGKSPCLDHAGATRLAVAPTPVGWIVVSERQGNLYVFVLDSQGVLRRAPRSMPGFAPILIARNGSAPLLLSTNGNTTTASFLDTNGLSTLNVPVFTNPTEAHLQSGVWTGDAFLLAARTTGVVVARLETNGTVSSVTAPGTTSTEYPQIAWTGTEARLTWADFGGTARMLWSRLDAMGVAVGTPVELGRIPDYFNPAPVETLANDSVILLGQHTGHTAHSDEMDIVRLDATGGTVMMPTTISADPNQKTQYDIARIGGRIYASWLSVGFPGRVSIVRLAL